MRFGSVHLNIATREIVLGGELQHLQPQAFDLLVYLVEHRDRVVPKAELLDQVWGDQFVSESALTTRIKEIRRATGDDGQRQSVIKNARGRGYRFVAPLADVVPDTPRSEEASRRHRPPPPLTPSVGLAAEIDRLADLTATRRLVSIVGPGGVGKTRLSLEVGRVVADRHALGTRLVELSRISEPDAVGPTIRRALDRSEIDADLSDGLGALDAFVVIDNCEHIIDAVAEQVPTLLAGGDELRILMTSREPLGLPGELRWALAPLSTVGANAPAMALFVERALDVAVRIDPTDARAQAIVAQLDGIPLALEMAAARLATMGVADLADELEESLASLRSGPRGVADRHSTLRAVLAWSEALLTPHQRSVLADFSIFAGPVDAVDVPGAVDAPDPVGEVCALAERSLVTVDTGTSGRARYGTLETVRQFSRERLEAEGRSDAVGRRHAHWFTEAAEEAAGTYDSVDQADAVARMDAIFDELRAAHSWGRAHEPSLAVRLSQALAEPAVQQLRLEVFDWSLALAQRISSDDTQAGRIYAELSQGLSLLGRIEEARQWAERAMATSSDPALCRAAYMTMADVCLYAGELDRSLQFARRHDEIVEREGTNIAWACGKVNLALPLAYLGRHDEALDLIPAAPLEGAPPTAWGWLAYARGEVLLDIDPETALAELDTATALAESVDGQYLSGVSQVSAASLRTRTGHPEDAIEPSARTITRLADRGNSTHLLTTLRNLPTLLVRLEEWRGAAEILGGVSRATISPTYGDEAERLTAAEKTSRAALGHETFELAHRHGAERSLYQTARFAVTVLDALR